MGVLPFSFYRGYCSSFLEEKWRNFIFFCLTKGAAICLYFFSLPSGSAIFSSFFTKRAHCPCYFPTLQRGRSLHTFISFPESPRTFLSLQTGRSLCFFSHSQRGVQFPYLFSFVSLSLFCLSMDFPLVLSLKKPDFTYIIIILTDEILFRC